MAETRAPRVRRNTTPASENDASPQGAEDGVERTRNATEPDAEALSTADNLTSPAESLTTHHVAEESEHDGVRQQTDVQSGKLIVELTHEATDTTDSQTQTDDPLHDPQRIHNFWNPFWLSQYFLASFAGILAASSIALVVLWVYSEHHHGFPLLTRNHYVWTYAPTAVLTIIVSLWSQISFWCMSLAPWQRLRKGNASANSTLLLDYVSPILPTALIKAVKLREWAVVIAIMCSILLKLVIVASTGLLVPATIQMAEESCELTTKTAFTANNNFAYDSQSDAQVLYQTYAVLSLGLPYQDGIQENAVYQTFEAPTSINTTGTLVSATVDALYPLIQCEPAQIIPLHTSQWSGGGQQIVVNISVSWPSCSETVANESSAQIYINDPAYNLVPPRQLYGRRSVDAIVCPESLNTTWLLFSVLEVQYNQSSIPHAILRNYTYDGTEIWGVQIMATRGLVCSVDYAFEKSRASYDFTKNPPNVDVDEPATYTGRLLGLDKDKFMEIYRSDSSMANLMLGNDFTNPFVEDYPDEFFGIMSKVVNASYTDFLHNESLMIEAATRVSNVSLLHSAAYRLVSNDSTSIEGGVQSSALRLHIPQLTLWLIVAGLTTTSLLAALLLWKRPVDDTPCNTASIGGLLLIVARSDRLRSLLQGTGRMSQRSIGNILSSYVFQSETHGGPSNSIFSIKPMTLRADVQSEIWKTTWRRASIQSIKWWRPLSLRPLLFVTISSLPIALIVTLEVLQRLSVRENGIATAPGLEDIRTTIVTRLVPSLVMVLVTILYDSICFNVSLYAPFQKLKSGNATMQCSLMSTIVGKTPPHALYVSIRHKHWAAAFANIATIVGSILTIAASGLYIIDGAPGAVDISLRRTDVFNLTWADSVVDDGGAAVITTAVEYFNLSYPLWTSDEIALPILQISDDFVKMANKTLDKQSMLTARIPALRPSLDCTVASEGEYSVQMTTVARDGDIGELFINVSAKLPPACQVGGLAGNQSILKWSSAFQFITFSSFVGTVTDLHVGSLDDGFLSSGEAKPFLQKDNLPGCPSLGFIFGNFSQPNGFFDSAASNFTIMTCSQLMIEIETDVKIQLPDWRVLSAVPDESTTRYLESVANGNKTFQYRPQPHLVLELIAFNYNKALSGVPSSADVLQDQVNVDYLIDSFFAVLLYGKRGIDPADLWGPHNQDRLVSAVQSLYRRYMAQVASLKMRTTSSPSAPTDRHDGLYEATWFNPDRNSVRQNNASKLVLQVALGVMFSCGVISFWLLDSKEVLTHDPCSIAGIASLVADSEICSDAHIALLPPNAEWFTETKLRENGLWRDWRFRMGWWEGTEGRPRRFGIDFDATTLET